MASSNNDDFNFIMSCIKHSSEKLKPNFEQVAADMGSKNTKAAYFRHWSIMKKWGMTGSKAADAGSALDGTPGKKKASAPATPRKRAKAKIEEDGKTGDEDTDEEVKKTPSKKVKF